MILIKFVGKPHDQESGKNNSNCSSPFFILFIYFTQSVNSSVHSGIVCWSPTIKVLSTSL